LAFRSPAWLAAIAALALIEAVWRLRSKRGYDGRAALATLGLVLGSLPFAAAQGLFVGAIAAATAALAPVPWPPDRPASWIMGFLAFELAYYCFHRASHRIAWMWATHSVHHSATQMTLLASLRLGWTNIVSLGWVFYLPLLLAGMSPLMVAVLRVANLRYQFLLHTEAVRSLGPLEWILNTPAHHRLHHAANPAYLDCNFGGVLIVFDRLFGTFKTSNPEEPICYGLAGRARSHNVLRLAFGEWVHLLRSAWRSKGPGHRLRLLAGPPRG
jgi:sterol desaturase/sphingolipid hydroxylase (fatty acid hydroxylase superfamily)